jgi:putative redox protein
MNKIEVERVSGDYGFEAKDAAGHIVKIDTSDETGGTNFGARPMQMLLMALGGCSGIDVVSILKKQRQTVNDFHMKITGERENNPGASLWKKVHIVFELKGKIDADKAKKACELSMDKYCSVAATLKAAGCDITWKVNIVHID